MKRKRKVSKENDIEIWTEEHYEHYMQGICGLEFVAGYTEGGVPYGNKITSIKGNELFTICMKYI